MTTAMAHVQQTSVSGKRRVAKGMAEYVAVRETAVAAFAQSARIQPLWHALTDATDRLLKAAAGKDITLLAVGGYGRRELFPYSDIDVLVLVPEDGDASASEAVIVLLQQLWDLNIPVSHAVRGLKATIAAAGADHTIATALMDMRHVAGDRRHYVALKQALKRNVFGSNKRAFIDAKLIERDKRHEKWGDSRFLLEPHIKDGKGGLRDLQTLTWLARYCYSVSKAADLVRPELLTDDERTHYREAYLFFSTVRAFVHILRGRADERLTFDLQNEIAARLKFTGVSNEARAEQFMQRYFSFTRHVGSLTRVFCAQLEEENLRGASSLLVPEALSHGLPEYLMLDNGRLNFSPRANLAKQPQQMIGLFDVTLQRGLDIHPQAHLKLTRALPKHGKKLPENNEANALFLSILLSEKSPEIILKRMNEMDVLAALIPEFVGISGQMQYDGYHTFTVDEHTLVAVGNLAAIEAGLWAEQFPLSTRVAKEISDRAPLYLAMLCHDIAKGMGGGHAGKGEDITKRVAKRLGLSKAQGELAAWLVAHHLVLSETAFKRDLDDPKTIGDFVARVQSPERLRLLLLVTVADIKAVGPTIWNGWKGALMRDLFTRAMAAMGVGDTAQKSEQPPEVGEVLTAWRLAPEKPAILVRHDTFRAVTELTCCIEYQPQLFRVLAGVMAWIGASIVSARIMVMEDGIAVASIGIQDVNGNAFNEEERLKTLPKLLKEGMAGKLDFGGELPRRRLLPRGREVAIHPAVFVDNQVSAQSSVIEVNAKDRLGLLYDILGALDACQLTVMTAHIATYGQKAIDVFYVKDAYGLKVTHPAKLAEIQKTLNEYVTKK